MSRGTLTQKLAVAIAALLALAVAAPAPTLDTVRVHFEHREYDAALAEATELLSRSEAEQGADSLPVADALEWIARAMVAARVGKREEQLAPAERALAIREKRLGPDDPRLALGVYVVGLVHYRAGDPATALPYFDRALRLSETSHGAADPELDRYLREQGAALFAAGRYPEALVAFRRLDTISRAKYGVGHPGTVPALFNLALVQDVMGELDEAERLYLDALAILERQQPIDTAKLAWTYDAHAGLLARQGRLGEALAECQRAIDLKRAIGPGSPELAESLVVQGRMLWMVGDYEESRARLNESVELLRKGEPTTVLYSANLNLAEVARLSGDLTAARAALDDARRAGQAAAMPESHSLWFDYHRALGEVQALLGERALARAAYVHGLEIASATMGERHYDYARTLAALGRLDLADGDARQARERLLRALTIFEAELGRGHPLCVEAEEQIGEAENALGLDRAAFTRGLDAERTRRELERATLAVLPERQALAQASLARDGRDLALALALPSDAPAERRTAAYDALIRSRAVVFDEIASRQRVFRASADPATQAKVESLREAKSRLAGLFVNGPGSDPAGYARRVQDARGRVESIETDLARRSAAYRARLAARDFGLEELRRALPRGSACLSYARYRRPGSGEGDEATSYAAIVQRSGVPSPAFVDLGQASAIDDAVARWRAALDPARVEQPGAEADYRLAAAALRRLAWDPVAPRLHDVTTLFVVPDGDLHLVSFTGLPDGVDSYLLDRGPAFHYLTAERDLVRRGGTARGMGLFALGDPKFEEAAASAASSNTYRGQGPSCADFGAARFGSLPATADEVAAVRAIWTEGGSRGDAKVLVGSAATEAEFKRRAPGREVLHLATHGFYLDENCGAPGPYRGIGGISARRDSASVLPIVATASPLLLSGLALAGANRRGEALPGAEDGILTAEEVSALDLSGVRLAVLSACRTGAGRVARGEGVFGLRRAFLLAGAAAVVTSLWDVEDHAGKTWIEEFYRARLLKHRTIPDAVGRASRAVLVARRAAGLNTHPFYWAGWLAVGDPD